MTVLPRSRSIKKHVATMSKQMEQFTSEDDKLYTTLNQPSLQTRPKSELDYKRKSQIIFKLGGSKTQKNLITLHKVRKR